MFKWTYKKYIYWNWEKEKKKVASSAVSNVTFHTKKSKWYTMKLKWLYIVSVCSTWSSFQNQKPENKQSIRWYKTMIYCNHKRTCKSSNCLCLLHTWILLWWELSGNRCKNRVVNGRCQYEARTSRHAGMSWHPSSYRQTPVLQECALFVCEIQGHIIICLVLKLLIFDWTILFGILSDTTLAMYMYLSGNFCSQANHPYN